MFWVHQSCPNPIIEIELRRKARLFEERQYQMHHIWPLPILENNRSGYFFLILLLLPLLSLSMTCCPFQPDVSLKYDISMQAGGGGRWSGMRGQSHPGDHSLSLFLLSITFSSHQRLCLLSNGNTLMVWIGIFPEKDPANPSSSMMTFVFIWLLQVTACPTCLAWGLWTQKLDRLVESPEAGLNYQEWTMT